MGQLLILPKNSVSCIVETLQIGNGLIYAAYGRVILEDVNYYTRQQIRLLRKMKCLPGCFKILSRLLRVIRTMMST